MNAEIVNDSLVAHIVYPSFDSSEITNQDIIELICEDIINW